MKKILILILICCVGDVFSQSVSMKSSLFSINCKKSNEFLKKNIDSSYFYVKKAIFHANDEQKSLAFYLAGYICKLKEDYYFSVFYYEQALQFCKPGKLLAMVKNNLANAYIEAGSPKKARVMATRVVRKLGICCPDLLAYAYNVAGNACSMLGENDSTMYYYNLSLFEAEKQKNNKLKVDAIRSMGKALGRMGLVDSALVRLNQAFAISKNMKPAFDRAAIAAKIAKMQILRKDFAKAEEFLKKSDMIKHNHAKTKVAQLEAWGDLFFERQERTKMFVVYSKVDEIARGQKGRLTAKDYEFFLNVREKMGNKLSLVAKDRTEAASFLLWVVALVVLVMLSAIFFLLWRAIKKQSAVLASTARLEAQNNQLLQRSSEMTETIKTMEGKIDIAFLGETIKADTEQRALAEIMRYVVDMGNPALLDFVQEQAEYMKKVNKLLYIFLRRYPDFSFNLETHIKSTDWDLYPKHQKLIFLMSARAAGHAISTDFVMSVLEYTKEGLKTAKRVLMDNFGVKNIKELGDVLLSLAERKVSKIRK